MEKRTMSDFIKFSQDIVREFLQTTVILDDRAYQNKGMPYSQPGSVQTPGRGDLKNKEPDTKSASFSDDKALDVKEITDGFLKSGIISCVIQYSSGTHLDGFYVLAKKSDIIVLDWELTKNSGVDCKSIIQELIKRDAASRLRMICIYTGNNDLKSIDAQVCSLLGGGVTRENKGHRLRLQATVITVYAKPDARPHLPTDEKENAIDHADLAECLIGDFANAYSGLLRNAAMKAFSLLRCNTFKTLNHLFDDVDAPYLAHRCLLPNSNDAEQYGTDIISALIAEAISNDDVSDCLDTDKIIEWISSKGFSESNIGGQAIDRIKLINGTYSPDTGSKDKFLKNNKDIMTSLFIKSGSHLKLNQAFAFMVSMCSFKQHYLHIGSIIKDADNNYYFCIQPECDSVGFGSAQNFVFIKISDKNSEGKFNVIIPENEMQYIEKLLSMTHKHLLTIPFAPIEGNDKIVLEVGREVRASSSDNKPYIFIAQMRRDPARRFVASYLKNISRIGIDEFEWLRRNNPKDS